MHVNKTGRLKQEISLYFKFFSPERICALHIIFRNAQDYAIIKTTQAVLASVYV